MIAKTNAKAFAWAGIALLGGGLVAIGTTVTEAVTSRINEGHAAVETARAETEKAKAEREKAEAAKAAAEAAKLAAENELKSAERSADAVLKAAIAVSNGTQIAAQETANGLRDSTHEAYHADNAQFDQVTAPLFTQPTERMAQLNAEIVRLKHEAQAGRDIGTKIVRLPSGRFEEVSILAEREAELEMLKQATTKNWSDLMGMVTGAIGGSLGDVSKLYPTGNEPAPARRFIVPEQ
jgi:hypothetical protein